MLASRSVFQRAHSNKYLLALTDTLLPRQSPLILVDWEFYTGRRETECFLLPIGRRGGLSSSDPPPKARSIGSHRNYIHVGQLSLPSNLFSFIAHVPKLCLVFVSQVDVSKSFVS